MEWISSIISLFFDFVKWIVKEFKKPDPALILEHRQKIKNELENKLPRKDENGSRGEAIIRDLKRMDSYPELDSKKGISPWFRVEIKDLYYRGLEVFIYPMQYIAKDENDEWKFVDYSYEHDKLIVYAVGRIPFDLIKSIDWEGDEFYNIPHIYCDFKGMRGTPYETIPLYYKKYEHSEYLSEVEDFRPYDKYIKKGFWFIKSKKQT
jgi:hypothetical protein